MVLQEFPLLQAIPYTRPDTPEFSSAHLNSLVDRNQVTDGEEKNLLSKRSPVSNAFPFSVFHISLLLYSSPDITVLRTLTSEDD
jgi:hypothetical protein